MNGVYVETQRETCITSRDRKTHLFPGTVWSGKPAEGPACRLRSSCLALKEEKEEEAFQIRVLSRWKELEELREREREREREK
jgi:hypothetical protein